LVRFRAGRLGEALLLVALVTLFGGYLMKIYAWKTMLGSDGAINTALLWLGLVDRPVTALLYSPFAVVLTLSHFLLPFAILPIAASLRGIADAEVESARDLGASGWRVLVDVVVPRARGGILAGFALAFLAAAGDYLTPQLVGGKMAMIGQLIAPQFGTFFNWPLGAAMSFSVLLAALLVLLALSAALGRVGRPSS
jgi:spermidine/putrescine transport system permease protein